MEMSNCGQHLKRLFRILKLAASDTDDVVRFHIQLSLEFLDAFMREYILGGSTIDAGRTNTIFNFNL